MVEENKKIQAVITFEMMGRPPEHLVETMKQLIEVLVKEKGVKLIKNEVHEAKQIDNRDKDGVLVTKGELYSTFAEVELELDDIMTLLWIEFKYLPSHVEIIKPESFNLSNLDLGSIMSEIAARLHHYDSIAKSALMNNQMLGNKFKQILDKYPEVAKDLEAEMNAQKNKENSKLEETKLEDEIEVKAEDKKQAKESKKKKR